MIITRMVRVRLLCHSCVIRRISIFRRMVRRVVVSLSALLLRIMRGRRVRLCVFRVCILSIAFMCFFLSQCASSSSCCVVCHLIIRLLRISCVSSYVSSYSYVSSSCSSFASSCYSYVSYYDSSDYYDSPVCSYILSSLIIRRAILIVSDLV